MTTAKIYQFPTKVRPAPGRFDDSRFAANFATNIVSPSVVPTAFGSGWYHDEAIADAERTRKN
jgi:Protein of unknown function (DUF2735)